MRVTSSVVRENSTVPVTAMFSCFVILIACYSASSQKQPPAEGKFDEFRYTLPQDVKARLDAFVNLTATGSPRSSICTEVNLWIAPSTSTKADEAGYCAQLMEEAGQNEYWVRRVELVGKAHIRDNILRRRFLQTEGDVFSSSKALEQSLKNLSTLRVIFPGTLNDVEGPARPRGETHRFDDSLPRATTHAWCLKALLALPILLEKGRTRMRLTEMVSCSG